MTTDRPLSLEYGSEVLYQGQRFLIRKESQDFVTVTLFSPETSQVCQAPIVELAPYVEVASPAPAREDLVAVDDEAWQEANHTYSIIKPLLDMPSRTKADVLRRAAECNVHYTTVYRWIREFESIGKISVFLRQPRRDKGDKRLSPEHEKIISEVIETFYLSKQKWSAAKVIREIAHRCAKAKPTPLPAPHDNTIRNRLKQLDSYKKIKAREGSKAAEASKLQIKGQFPGAEVPLAVVQVDHTEVDLILVDNLHRQPIGRPWLTLLIDVCTRMVLGFYISFDPPGNLSLGLCLAHAFLPKEKWLHNLGIETTWPCWGVPRTIHADNAKEFRGLMLKKACQEYGINLEWRPVAKPRYGAHIERLLGTLMEDIHGLAGTTFSNPQQRGEYDSEGESSMSLEEFERWFTHLCLDIYHQRPHSHLGMPPIAKWQEGILGTRKTPGIGLPTRITNEQKLKLDLMPFDEKTVQHYGIVWDKVQYQHDVLRRWINEPDPDHPKHKRKFLCRRDPRDISVIWFYDPEVHQYYAIPYRNTAHPAISIWELREANKRARAERADIPVDEERIFSAYEQMREIEETAKKTTKTVRRNNERKRVGVTKARAHVKREEPPEATEVVTPDKRRELRPFTDVDDMQDE